MNPRRGRLVKPLGPTMACERPNAAPEDDSLSGWRRSREDAVISGSTWTPAGKRDFIARESAESESILGVRNNPSHVARVARNFACEIKAKSRTATSSLQATMLITSLRGRRNVRFSRALAHDSNEGFKHHRSNYVGETEGGGALISSLGRFSPEEKKKGFLNR